MRIAVVQCNPLVDAAVEASDLIARQLAAADAASIDLVVFPEAFLLGHSYDRATILARARAASQIALATLTKRIRAFRATLVVGVFEFEDARVRNSAVVIERGRIVGRYAKAYPNEPGVTAGADFPTFSSAGTRFGINICNDANHRNAAERIMEQEAALILYPLNNLLKGKTAARWREKSLANLVERARQTGCWIASSDVTGTVGDSVSYGCTAIVSPDGEVVARVPEFQEGVAVYDLPVRLSQSR